MRERTIGLVFLALTSVVACGEVAPTVLGAGGSGTTERVCTPGAQVACACVGGLSGAQVCNADGSQLGTCMCGAGGAGGAATTTIEAGGSGGAITTISAGGSGGSTATNACDTAGGEVYVSPTDGGTCDLTIIGSVPGCTQDACEACTEPLDCLPVCCTCGDGVTQYAATGCLNPTGEPGAGRCMTAGDVCGDVHSRAYGCAGAGGSGQGGGGGSGGGSGGAGGGGPCRKCAEALSLATSANLCDASAPLFDALVSCVCDVADCFTECQGSICAKPMAEASTDCGVCAQAKCADAVGACMNDV